MYVEAELALAFVGATQRVRVAQPGWGGKVLHLLTLGRASEQWERETFDTVTMVANLAGALKAAGVQDVVSVSADDELIYFDERRTNLDLGPAMAKLQALAAERTGWPARLEVVAEHRTDVATTLIQLVADRVHPIDRPPLRLRAYALLREFDVADLGSTGYRQGGSITEKLRAAMLPALSSTAAHDNVVGRLRESTVALAGRLEEVLRDHLGTHPGGAAVRSCIVRARQELDYEASSLSLELDRSPPLRGYPGMREATFYLRLWLPLLRAGRATVRRTLFVDEGGRPLLHIQDEPLAVAETEATAPGGKITAGLGIVDAVFFGGNDYEEELRAGLCIPHETALAGDAAWEEIRRREMGVKHTFLGAFDGETADTGGAGGLTVIGGGAGFA